MKEQHGKTIDLQYITNNIYKYYIERKRQSLALLDATKFNPVNLHGDRKITNDNVSQKFEKVKPWLRNAYHCDTKSVQLIEEISRVKVLNTKKDFII